jgi:hypothetical protein
MKGIFPLEQFPLRERTPMCVALVIFLVVWVVMMLASTNRAPGVATGIGFVLEASFLLAFAIGAIQMKALAQAREVLAGQPLPLSLWRTWVRASVAETSLAWAFLAAGMGTLLTTRGSNMPWLGAVALLSSSMVTGALCVLAQNAMAPRKLGWLANAAVVALLVAALIFGTGEVLTWFVGLPLPMLALLALSWPALGAMLTLRLSGQRGAHSTLAPASRHKWLASASRWMRRHTPLDATWARQPHARKATARSRLDWIGRNVLWWFFLASSMTPLRWEEGPDLRHLLSLVFLCLIMSETLIARDLHWRWLLTPGGWRAGRIASDIFASTLKICYLVIAAVLLVWVVWTRLVMGQDALAVISKSASHVLVLAEVAFAVSAGLVILVLPHRRVVACGFAVVVAGLWIYTRMVGRSGLSQAPPAGVMYAAILVASAYAILRVADRLWTKEKLMACARGAI